MFTKTGWIYTRIWLFVQDIENDVYYEYVSFIRWCIFYKVIILLRFRICRMGSRGYYLFTALKHSLRRVQIRFDGSDWGWMVVHTIGFCISDAVCLLWKGGEWNGSAQTLYKKVGVLPIRIVKSNVSSVGPVSLWRKANARNVRL